MEKTRITTIKISREIHDKIDKLRRNTPYGVVSFNSYVSFMLEKLINELEGGWEKR